MLPWCSGVWGFVVWDWWMWCSVREAGSWVGMLEMRIMGCGMRMLAPMLVGRVAWRLHLLLIWVGVAVDRNKLGAHGCC